MSINDNIKFLENIKQKIQREISWSKYRCEITTKPKSNLDYMIDSTFRNINRLFLFSFKNANVTPRRNSLDEHYMPLVEIKDFNALIDNKLFFNRVKTNKKPMTWNLLEI